MRGMLVAAVLSVSTTVSAESLVIDRSAPPSAADGEETIGEPVILPSPKPPNTWKPIFGASLGAAVAASAFAYYAQSMRDDEAGQITTTRPWGALTEEDCGSAVADLHFARACTWNRRATIGMFSAVGFGAFTLVAAYFAFRAKPSDRMIAITPTSAELVLAW